MVFPLRPDPLDPNVEHLRPSSAANPEHEPATAAHSVTEPARDDDLQRLESSVQWLKREVLIVRLEDGLRAQKQRRALSRAGQLPTVSGIPPVNIESSCHGRKAWSLQLVPPLSDRLPFTPPRRQHRRNFLVALLVLIASLIAGSLAHHSSTEGIFSDSEPVQAASLQAR